jgi:hypothetical protein
MKKLFLLFAVAGTLAFTSCGGDQKQEATEETKTEEAPATEEAPKEEAPAVEETPAPADSAKVEETPATK